MQSLLSRHQVVHHVPVSTAQPRNAHRALLLDKRIGPATRTRCSLTEASVAAGQHGDEALRNLIARYDSDGDGRLTLQEVEEVLNAYQALPFTPATPAPAPPASPSLPPPPAPTLPPTATSSSVTWDLQVLNGIKAARARGEGLASAFLGYMSRKLSNSGRARTSLSDLVWSFAGMFAAVLALGVLNLHVRDWPVVGAWHQQGLGLLLGSFGTLCVLIFGRPDAEAVRIWNLLAGHVIAITTVITLLHVLGPSLLSRSLAMACMIAAMLLTDSVHPPGGALVLMAVDSATIQRMDWWFMVYPSLTFTVAVLLPLGWAVNWLKRNIRFDFPAAAAAAPPGLGSATTPPPPDPTPVLRPKLA